MPEKKNQHLVPACYLKNFEADVAKMQKLNPNFSRGVYVNNNRLSDKWRLKSVNNNIFTKSYYYTLHDDDVRQPIIENFLSKVEGDYAKYSSQVIGGNINNENLSFLSYFVTLQFIRVDKFIGSVQGSWNKVAGWMDDFEGTDHYKDALKDIVKRMLPEVDLGGIVHPYAKILLNKTNFPFITSDSPVVRKDMNITDAYKIIPRRYLRNTTNESKEYPCFFLPLSPNLAYISLELIEHSNELVYSYEDLENIFYLNYNTIINSHELVYSPIEEPMKAERELSEYLSRKVATFVKIYTETKRIIEGGAIVANE
ncbi:DUF4238 domain-containing protein [Marinagarivorans cellulosilyticus]|uniref:DUF4238 domain-containing protein n=1 Tax=Marinagarivorans cellulosilyticus TaxID=2721545 RepID=A0AAN1WG32_9GAMM|nr:DUF4238 domain-containing protein [Marinagarivorans cellulosilyticus]BCD96955.1 hypothetical protein MARGE09_P1155 [Marinagarivorans cellulosilyticus]